MRKNLSPYFLASVAILFWSTAATAFKLTLAHQHFSIVLLISSLTAATVMLVISLFQGRKKALFRIQPHTLLLGFLNPFLYYFLLFQAYTRLPAQLAQPLNFLWPLMIVLFSIPILKQPLRLRDIGSLFVSLIGVFIISSRGSFISLAATDLTGVLLAVSSSLVWGIYFVLNVRNQAPVTVTLFHSFLWGAVLIGSYIMLSGCGETITTAGFWGSIYIGIFEMGLTFFIWISALKAAPNTAVLSNYIYLTPFVSLIFISLILKEHLYSSTFIGLGCIIFSILLQKRRPVV